MEFDAPLMCAPALEDAIDSSPLTLPPDTLLIDAISLMSYTRGQSCKLDENLNPIKIENGRSESRSSCVLVMQDSALVGIFTERDIVRFAATGMSFDDVKISQVMIKPVITLNQAYLQDVFAALFLFRRYRIRHLPIVDEQEKLIGVISPESIRQVLRPANLLKLRRVADVMSKEVISSSPMTSVLELAKLMANSKVSCVVITQQDSIGRANPVGIVTERDIVQFQSLGLELAKIQAQDVMSTPLFLLNPEDSLWKAHQQMQRRHVRRLVVSLNWGWGLGIVTQTSLLKIFDPVEMYAIIYTLQKTVEQLEAQKLQSSTKKQM